MRPKCGKGEVSGPGGLQMWRGGQSIPTASPTMVPYPGRWWTGCPCQGSGHWESRVAGLEEESPWESGPPPLGHAELPGNGQRWTLCPAAAAAAGGGEVVRSSCLRSASVHTQHRGWPRGGDMLTFRDNSWYQSGNKRCCQRQAETDRKREKRVSPAAQPVGRALATLLSSQA